LWGWTASHAEQRVIAGYYTKTTAKSVTVVGGMGHAAFRQACYGPRAGEGLQVEWTELYGLDLQFYRAYIQTFGLFRVYKNSIHFPLWHPTLVLALAAVAAIRVGRRFTLWATIVATTIIAALLGMVAAL
jgi:hypothetical protein